MELSANNGGELPFSPFDVNADREFGTDDAFDDDGDATTAAINAGGRKSKVGIAPTPGILSMPQEKLEQKYLSGSTGRIDSFLENPGASKVGRQSWRELK